MLQGTHGGHADDAGIAQTADHLLVRAAAVAHGTQTVFHSQVQQLLGIGLEHMEIQTERLVIREALDLEDFGLDPVGRNRGSGQKAEAAGIGGGGH